MPNDTTRSASRVGIIAGFAAVYLIWGSTYLAIRVGVETLPPFMMAGVRFASAGIILYLFAMRRGLAPPTRAQWKSAAVVGGLLLLGGNGMVTFAEQTVPSGVAALMVATVPLWMVILNWAQPGGIRPGAPVFAGLVLGFVGVAILIGPFSSRAASANGHSVDPVGAMALLFAALSWSVGSLYSRRANLPSSLLVATAAEMLAGGALLVIVGLITGEVGRIDVSHISPRSLMALAYLTVFGSLIAFTAYIWLLSVSTPARVATYAYVNPVVAVMLGWAFAGESITSAMLIAMATIVVSVAMITRHGPAPAKQTQEEQITEACKPATFAEPLTRPAVADRCGGTVVCDTERS